MIAPKGKLIPIGGSENKDCRERGDCPLSFYNRGILKRLLAEMKGGESRLELVPTASGIPEDVSRRYLEAFRKLGCGNVGILPVRDRADALKPEYTERINKADGVFFTGGDQSRLSEVFCGTEFATTLAGRYLNSEFVIAGTSAGAMAMSGTMITGGPASSFKKGDVEMGAGLSFIDHVIIDTHFIERGRYGRLTQAVAALPGCIGIGLGEDTGLVISHNNDIEVIGSGQVILFDGHAMHLPDAAPASSGISSSIENMTVHVLAVDDKYCLTSRAFAHDEAALAS
ncbi:MAG: cyanophycinase [Balneolales bacterium]